MTGDAPENHPFVRDDTESFLSKERSTLNGKRAAPIAVITKAANIMPQRINWLWKDCIARKMLQILAGPPGVGKSTVAYDLASTVSIGGTFPDGTSAAPADVVIWSGEDPIAEVIIPRLLAAGADMDRIGIVSGITASGKTRAFNPATDIAILAESMRGLANPGLLIIDPLVLVNGTKNDSHKNAETRNALQPLSDLVALTGAAALGFHHFTKGTEGRSPIDRISGSLAYGAASRVAMVAVKTQEPSKRIFARAKSNISTDYGGFYYHLSPYILPEPHNFETTRVQWDEYREGDARDLLNEAEGVTQGTGGEQTRAAQASLKEMLKDGPIDTATIKQDAKAGGYCWRTVNKAKKQLGIVSMKDANDSLPWAQGPWKWQLPDIHR